MTQSLLVFIGPSGSGKSTIVRTLVERRVVTVHPTWTTRPRRADEAAGSVEHRFVSESEFLRLRDQGFFLHAVQMFGLPYWYGLPTIDWSDGPAIDALMLRAPLVPVLRAAYPGPDHVVYQIEASLRLVDARLAARAYSPDELEARLADNERERDAGRRVAHRFFFNDQSLAAIVDDIERAVREDFAPALLEAQ